MKCKRCNIDLEFDSDYCENCQDKIVERIKDKYGVDLDDCSWTMKYHEQMNKHVKISTHLYAAWQDMRWHKETDPEYMNQILDYFEGVEPDDAPDSCSSLLREVMDEGEAFIL